MTYREAEQRLASDLQILYSSRESGQLASWVMEKITGLQRVDRLLQKNQPLSSDQEEYWELIRARLLQHEIDHFLGVLMFDRMLPDQRELAIVEYAKVGEGPADAEPVYLRLS